MKKITYTNMRSELSEILELLRSGESVTITQRGKPDIILNGIIDSENVKPHLSNNANLNLSPNFIKGIQKMNNHVNEFLSSPEIKKNIDALNHVALKFNNMSEEFRKALFYTQTKHADIIKKLEDK